MLLGPVAAVVVIYARLDMLVIGALERISTTVDYGFFEDLGLFADEFQFARNIYVIFTLKLRSEKKIFGTGANQTPSQQQLH